MLCQCSADFCNANGTKALDNENTVMASINNELSDEAQRLGILAARLSAP